VGRGNIMPITSLTDPAMTLPLKGEGVDKAVEWACSCRTLEAALAAIAIWEMERALKQIKQFEESRLSTAAHGGSHDTCFRHCFELVIKKWNEIKKMKSMKKYVIISEVDTNVGDYESQETTISEEQLDNITPIIEAIKKNGPKLRFETGDCGSSGVEIYGEMEHYKYFVDYILPWPAHGFHTIYSIKYYPIELRPKATTLL